MTKAKPDLILYAETNGWKQYRCSSPGCEWKREFMGEGTSAEREGLAHVESHTIEMRVSEFMTVRGGMGNDAFAAVSNLVNVARAMFANEGIDLKTVESFRCRVTRNHDADDAGGDPIAMWDTWVEVEFPAPAGEADE